MTLRILGPWIWDKILRSEDLDACWPWLCTTNKDGYGVASCDGKMQLAHRLVFRLINGDFDILLKVLHSCDNPPCCNPRHLFLGTQTDNIHDMWQKGRARTGFMELEVRRIALEARLNIGYVESAKKGAYTRRAKTSKIVEFLTPPAR